MKEKKSNKEPEIIIDLSFDEMVDMFCNTPKEKVDALIEKDKKEKSKTRPKKKKS